MKSATSFFAFLSVLALTFGVLGVIPAHATTLTVTNANDSGPGSLRQAIVGAAAGDTITFAGNYTILLTSQLTINKNLTIDGTGHSITVSGQNAVRVFYVNSGVTFYLNNLTVTKGKATNDIGGGIYTRDATVTVTNSIFSSNSAVGAVGTSAYGGGIGSVRGTLTVTNSTFSGNSANIGGGILIWTSAVTIMNSTFSGNSAIEGGGAIHLWGGTLTVANSTISSNSSSGGGSYYYASSIYINPGTVTMKNTIMANSTTDKNCFIVQGTFTDGGGNLVWGNSSSCPGINANPKLGMLGFYGGPTQTIPLLDGSAAIDTGNDATCASTDQRGIARPKGSHCDKGAYEVELQAGPALTVNTAADHDNGVCSDSDCSLREAIAAAATGDTVNFAGNYTILLTSQLTINKNLTIDGTGHSITVSGQNAVRVFYVNSGVTVTLQGLTITKGNAGSDFGGGIFNKGILTIIETTIEFNNANSGGGIYTTYEPFYAGLTMRHSIIRSNNATGGVGGGICIGENASRNVVALEDSKFINNHATNGGGGIYNFSSSTFRDNKVVINRCSFSGNKTDRSNTGSNSNYHGGGGIANASFGGSLEVNESDFSNNEGGPRGGAISNSGGTLSVKDSIFTDNIAGTLPLPLPNMGGGAIFNATNATATVSSSTFAANKSRSVGGAILNASSLTITNSTFYANSTIAETEAGTPGIQGSLSCTYVGCGTEFAICRRCTYTPGSIPTARAYKGQGGGVYNYSGVLTLVNNTFSGNVADTSLGPGGGGVYNKSGGVVNVKNTILANSIGGDCIGEINVNDHNLIMDGSCSPYRSGDPHLGALSDNGGNTLTMALPPDNQPNSNNCVGTDQRGVTRSQGGNGDGTAICDIGAYERQKVLFARPGGLTSGLCESWKNACELRYALTSSALGWQIWVAAGMYKPTAGADRAATFQLKNGVAVYGGFAGTETTRDQRNIATNATILSGDIGTLGNNSDNSYHVVTGATSATLDGFTITAGNANGSSCPGSSASCGGGMYNSSSSPNLTNVTFSGNSAGLGGGMYNYSNSPILTNVTFSSNSAGKDGGGMNNYSSSPTLTNVTFSDNSAGKDGGGMNNYSSSPTLTNVTFSGNSVGNSGGGMNNYSSSPTLTNVTFSDNSAGNNGGGMNNYSSSPQIRNTIFWGNTATSGGAQVYDEGSSPVISDCVMQNGYAGGTNIITADPKLGALGYYGGYTQILALLLGSSAINTGNDAICPATDQRGTIRPQGVHCDIGAYEFVP